MSGGVLAFVTRSRSIVAKRWNSTIQAARGATANDNDNDNANATNNKADEESPPATVLTCKPLGPRWTRPASDGDPADIFAEERRIGNPYLNETDYSPATKETIDALRKCKDVDRSKIRDHAERVLELAASSMSSSSSSSEEGNAALVPADVEEYLRILKEWHESLLFVNPAAEERNVASHRATIALPPGIQNLGATCYLNTQLQCLAQNPVFLDGIFSWRQVHPTHTMNGVMTKLQKLLAQMLVGGESTYTSLDFSNALGIQHDEQQDPNEFARLLFDRMEESFQQCSDN
eukprot:jgi/Psemu1/208944/e_gw1.484.17.1